MKKLTIATRGSKLALYQANTVKAALEAAHPGLQCELNVIKTQGDLILNVPLSQIGDKGLFTKELEQAMMAGEADIAVHSLKDMPAQLPEGMCIRCVLPRADVRDALISRNGLLLHDLPQGAVVGTSSLRRRAQLLAIRPDVKIVDMRGNVDTRLRKLHDEDCDAIILAGAGLLRLGYDGHITQYLDVEQFIPAASQGIIGIESLEKDEATLALLAAINHLPTYRAALAERSFLRTIEGGCKLPMGCHTRFNGNTFSIVGFIGSLDGKTIFRKTMNGNAAQAEDLAKQVALGLLADGGATILKECQ